MCGLSISGMHVIFVQCTYWIDFEVIRGLAQLAHHGQSLWVLNTSATQCHFKSYCTYIEACLIPKNATMEVWWQSPTSEKKTPWHMGCGSGHKLVWYLCNIHVQRVWSCSHHMVWPSWLIMGRVFKFSAHLVLNRPQITKYSPYIMPNDWKTWPLKCVGGGTGGSVAGCVSTVQVQQTVLIFRVL